MSDQGLEENQTPAMRSAARATPQTSDICETFWYPVMTDMFFIACLIVPFFFYSVFLRSPLDTF